MGLPRGRGVGRHDGAGVGGQELLVPDNQGHPSVTHPGHLLRGTQGHLAALFPLVLQGRWW